MTKRAASRTALLVAGLRAMATARAQPICRDPFARALAGDEGMAIARAFEADAFPHAELWLALRTAFLDRELMAQVSHRGLSQVVLLGAGFDTRAARLTFPGVRWFEVDHTESQAEKRRRIAGVAGYPEGAATYASCDFTCEDFLDRLVAVGFDVERPAAFVWEGVTMYLDEAAIRATLSRVARGAHPRSVLMFDYVGKRLAARSTGRAADEALLESVAAMGEPFRFGIDDVVPLLAQEGFRYARTTSFDELALELTGSYDRARAFRFQRLCVASATPP